MDFSEYTDKEVSIHYVEMLEYMDGLVDILKVTQDQFLACDKEIQLIHKELKNRNIKIKDVD